MKETRKVLFIDWAHPVLEERLSEMGFECIHQNTSSREELLKELPQYYGLIVRSRIKLDKEFLDHTRNLAFIGRTGIGLEHIDLAYAKQLGIKVFNTPEGSRDTVGEHALGLLLCLLNNLSRAHREVQEGKWMREGNRGVEIMGKTVGILGYGNTGTAFARRLQGFGARIIAYDKYKTGYADGIVEEVSLAEIFDECDMLSIHIPYDEHNHYFINEAFLEQFRKSIFLVNTSRGLVLETNALVEALKRGLLAGAALDVHEYEEQSFAHLDPDELPAPFQYLRRAENVVLNPHIAGWSHEAKKRHATVLVEKIRRAFG